MKASEIITEAQQEIGITEFPPNSNKVKYNDWYYGKSVSGSQYPWCATFISWLFQGTDLCKKTASCVDMLEWFEKNKRIVDKPQAGDIVFFKYSTNARRTNHVGLVIAVQGKIVATIEGNTAVGNDDNGGAVMMRKRSGNIVAYARPIYDDAPKVSNESKTEEIPISQYPTLKLGADGLWVVLLQQKLCAHGFNVAINGKFDNSVKLQLIAFQGMNGLVKDGICGQKTWNKLI